jgi:hypothetical protein
MMVLVMVGSINPIHTSSAMCIPDIPGMIFIRNESVITMNKVAINSATMIFHIHFIAFFISASLKLSFP